MAATRLLRGSALVALVLTTSLIVSDLSAQAPPTVVGTDKTGYLAGETVAISGSGFAANEAVTVQVAHADGAAEASGNHEPFVVTADGAGAFAASWPVGDDAAGHNFVVTASGVARRGSTLFSRVATVDTDKYDYQLGETVQISGAGFRAGEIVTIHVAHSNDTEDSSSHVPFAAFADDSGRVTAFWAVTDESNIGSILRVTATGSASGLVATTTITDPPITMIDTAGVDDTAGSEDVNFYQFEALPNVGGAPAVALAMALDDTAFPAPVQTCAFLDTDADGLTNRMVCASVSGNPPAVSGLSVFACADTTFTCASATPVSPVTSVATASSAPADPFGGAHVCTGTDCSTRDTVINVTVRNADLGLPPVGRPDVTVTNACTNSDCVNPLGAGFIAINKQIGVTGVTSPFTFTLGAGQSALNGQSTFTLTPNLNQGSASTDFVAFAPGSYSVNEQIPFGWRLTSATCRTPTETGPSNLPLAGPASAGVQNLTVSGGRLTRCVFVNEKFNAPSVTLTKLTNGTDNNEPDRLFIPTGSSVTWSYIVTNNGDVDLTDLVVTDDNGTPGNTADDFTAGTIASLAQGASATVTFTGTAVAGPYANTGTVTATYSGATVSASDVEFYFGQAPSIELRKLVNGDDANTAPGATIAAGATVNFSFVVTNTGNTNLAPINVTDDRFGAVCEIASLAPGASETCAMTAAATAGQHTNTGSVIAVVPNWNNGPMTDTDPGNYFGALAEISIVKVTNGVNNDVPPGQMAQFGSTVTWTYTVTNSGSVALDNVVVRDDNGTAGNAADDFTVCSIGSLAAGASHTCTASRPAVKGQYRNVGTATGAWSGTTVSDSDVDHYFGASPAISVVKLTNGTDNNAAPGPLVAIGSTVTWTYTVTNSGNVALEHVSVVDDGGPNASFIACQFDSIPAGQSRTCTATGVAIAGQYVNTVEASGTGWHNTTVRATDVDHYFGSSAAIDLIKRVNGDDANAAPGPLVNVGSTVTFTFEVRNTGNVTLAPVAVIDNVLGGICTIASLAPGASQTCTATSIAVSGQHTNIATATGKPPAGANVTDSDPGNYYGRTQTAVCIANVLPLNAGSSSTSGTPGNIRTLVGTNVSVKASAFSRTKGSSGTWSTAFLGTYGSYGLGVTDGSEGSGSYDRHKVDNIDRLNYVLFEFSKPVVVSKAYLAYVGVDSDATFWLGNKTSPYTNHQSLNDAFLASLSGPQTSLASNGEDRWASFNSSSGVGNILVVAADPGDTSPDDAFKLAKLELCVPSTSNQPPDAKNDSLKTLKNQSKTISVLINDTDPEGNTLTVTGVTQPAHGSAVVNSNGSVTYTPPYLWTGTTSFTYSIKDGQGGTDTAVVSVTVSSHYYGDDCGYNHDDDNNWWEDLLDAWWDGDDDDWWKYDSSGSDAHEHVSSGICFHTSHYKTWW